MKTPCKTLVSFLFCFTLLQQVFSQTWVARHGLSPADYQAAFSSYAQQGYRLKTVCGYTCNGQEKYIAYWEKAAGPEWAARHGMSARDYQTAFDDFNKKGFRLMWVSGYAVGNQTKFAAIWQKQGGAAWVAKHNMTAADYQTAFNTYVQQGYRLVHVSGYVVGNTEYFAAIWDKSTGPAWTARHNMTAAQYQQAFNANLQQGYTLKIVSGYNKSGTDLYAAIWEKTASPLWSARHGISAANYQYAFDNMYYQGYKPECLTAFASGNSCKYNGIWTNKNMKGADINAIDNAVKQYMNSQSVNGLSLAVCKNGRLVFAKGYGSANLSTDEEMSPDQPMRIMSISKSVTSVGIMTLLDQHKISLDAFVFGPQGILGSTYPTPSVNQKLNNIRVRHLLTHTSGLRTCNGESVFWDQTKTPADAMNVLMNANNLITTDTSMQYIYSNTNYFFLARVIEQISGQSYETYIRNNVLNPSGVGTTMYVGDASGNPRSGEASYTPMFNMNLQLWGGFGGWVARPIDLLKFLVHCDGLPTPPDIISTATRKVMITGTTLNPSYACGWIVSGDLQSHNGSHSATRSFLVKLAGGISYAVIINNAPASDDYGFTMKASIEGGLSQVSGYPGYDLF